jgi:hypothetical protein
MRILYKKHVKRIIIYNINIIYYNALQVYIYIYIYTCHYIHVARDAATDTAVVGHYKGGCTYVFNGAEFFN